MSSVDEKKDIWLTTVVGGAIFYSVAWLILGGDRLRTGFDWLIFLLSPLLFAVVVLLSYLPIVGLLALGMRGVRKKADRIAELNREVEAHVRSGDLKTAHQLACIARNKAEADLNAWIGTEPSCFETWLYGRDYKKPSSFRDPSGWRNRRYWKTYRDRCYVEQKIGEAVQAASSS